MGNLGIRTKIRLAIGLLGAGFVALLLLVLWTGSLTQTHMQIASSSLFPSALSSQQAEADFQKLIQHYSDAVLMQDKKALGLADESAKAVETSLHATQEHTAFDPARQQEVSSLLRTFEDVNSRARSTYGALLDSKGAMSDQAMSAIGTLAQDNKQLSASFLDLRTHLSTDFQAQLEAVATWSARQRSMGLVLFLITTACAIFLTIMIERQVSRPLQMLTQRLRDIAEGEGDLTKRLEIVSKDELGQVSSWFNLFMDKLEDVMRRVSDNTRQVASATQKLSATNQQITANSQETSSQANVVSNAAQQVTQNLQTVATGAEEMGSSIKDIAKNATEAAKIATSAVQVAETANATVSKLGDSSTEIGQVIKVITSIAQQTNLLALNATIEAARAGEAGKGFAVVANEVKELAKETAKATEDISRKIEAIQSDTKAAVEAIASISGIITQINDISNTIATAVEEQNATTNEMVRNVSEAARGSGEITSNINGVAQAAESTSRGATDTQNAAQLLVETSAQLQRLVEQFKIRSNSQSEVSKSSYQAKAASAGGR